MDPNATTFVVRLSTGDTREINVPNDYPFPLFYAEHSALTWHNNNRNNGDQDMNVWVVFSGPKGKRREP